MKIQIVKSLDTDEILGFKRILLEDFINSKEIMNNQCTTIVLDDVLSYFDTDIVKTILKLCVDKMRLNAELYIKDINFSILFTRYLNSSIDPNEFCEILKERKSYLNYIEICKIINSLYITSLAVKGIEYEISAIRKI